MAIDLTLMNGTDSISGSRITINDNFQVLEDVLNQLLSVFNVETGKFNNYGYGSDNDVETEDLIVRGSTSGGITVVSGSITLSNGNVVLPGAGYVEFGSGSNTKLQRATKNFFVASGNIPTLNFAGVGTTGGTGPIGYLGIPRLDTSSIEDIQYPQVGALVADVSGATAVLKFCSASGTTGTWIAIT